VGDESTAASKVLSRGSDSCSNDYASKRVGQSLSELHASCTPTWRVLSVWFVDALSLRACACVRACLCCARRSETQSTIYSTTTPTGWCTTLINPLRIPYCQDFSLSRPPSLPACPTPHTLCDTHLRTHTHTQMVKMSRGELVARLAREQQLRAKLEALCRGYNRAAPTPHARPPAPGAPREGGKGGGGGGRREGLQPRRAPAPRCRERERERERERDCVCVYGV
jgi:hypothetical protein